MLMERLQTRPAGDDMFIAAPTGITAGARLFGGQVIAQALDAVYHTVENRTCHSLHCYFVRPGSPSQPLEFRVRRIRDGGSFTTRYASIFQEGAEIFSLLASFHNEEDSVIHQDEMPSVPSPESLLAMNGDNRPKSITEAVEMLQVDPRAHPEEVMPPRKRVWLRLEECRGLSLRQQHLALGFASDMNLLETAMRPHGLFWSSSGFQSASLDHAVWFHRAFDFSQWHLFTQESAIAYGGRGFTRATIHARSGELVASVAQEGLLRLRR